MPAFHLIVFPVYLLSLSHSISNSFLFLHLNSIMHGYYISGLFFYFSVCLSCWKVRVDPLNSNNSSTNSNNSSTNTTSLLRVFVSVCVCVCVCVCERKNLIPRLTCNAQRNPLPPQPPTAVGLVCCICRCRSSSKRERGREEERGDQWKRPSYSATSVATREARRKERRTRGEIDEIFSKKKSKNFNFKNLFFSFITDTILSYVRTLKKIHNLKIPKR